MHESPFVGSGRNSWEVEESEFINELVLNGILDLRTNIPHDQVLALLPACDIGIVYVFENSITTRLAEPTKLFEYFASFLPVIASNVRTVRKIIQKWDCGLLFDPTLPSSIADAILQLIENQDMREKFSVNAARAAREELNWENEQPKLIRLLEFSVSDMICQILRYKYAYHDTCSTLCS